MSDQCPPEVEAAKNRRSYPAFAAWWARYQEAAAAHEEATSEWTEARADFLGTRPISIAGLRAFLEHIDGPFSSGDAGSAYWDDEERAQAIPTIVAASYELIGRKA